MKVVVSYIFNFAKWPSPVNSQPPSTPLQASYSFIYKLSEGLTRAFGKCRRSQDGSCKVLEATSTPCLAALTYWTQPVVGKLPMYLEPVNVGRDVGQTGF